ncbi:wall-associated receptor kinase-like 22 isoform X2 [Apium graveolens]|uniref:wall-associated receptor kinase-like 22 isoform X2 n=1 Tax=Apium graveolens TaxID=4045 RepID=UPI003D7A50D2
MGVKLLIQMWIILLVMLMFIEGAFTQNTTNRSLALPGCEERCGSLVVPYPFGIGPNCAANASMDISCDSSFNPPKAFLNSLSYSNYEESKALEVVKISVEAGTIHINYPITKDCTINTTSSSPILDLDPPYTFSNTENRFTAMGCDYLALLYSFTKTKSTPNDFVQTGVGGCVPSCDASLKKDNNCLGINCCQIQFPASLWSVNPSLSSDCTDEPRYAFIVELSWFKKLKDIYNVQTMETVPAVLDWTTGSDCRFSTNHTLCGVNALCTNLSLCSCTEGYEGNPYLPDGCQDINECTFKPGSSLKRNRCQHNCNNTPGNYTCSCKDGWLLADNYKCVKLEVVDHRIKKVAIVAIIATCAALGVLLAATWWLYKEIRRRIKCKLEEKFFKRNGGLLLRQQVSSSQGMVETTKLFTTKELEKATDRYNVDRIVGQGGQGTVYKGMLTNGRIVAVKKSTIDDESKLEHFINEVVILSQINHRNVVKLHGCCLQTEVPLLVYEFIPNGTLMQYIHEDNEYFPLTWDVRLRVATEVAGALYYLHSVASTPIYHRDIKSTNILLDEKYIAKVADFGTSKSFSIDQTHMTTRVQGHKPILAARLDDEARGLATLFLSAMEENGLLDIIDSRIINEGKREEMIAFANIAYRCLNLNGRRRPTMKQVVVELESIRNTHESPTVQQNFEEVEYGRHELNATWESDFTSSSISSTGYHSLSVDIQPLVTNQ